MKQFFLSLSLVLVCVAVHAQKIRGNYFDAFGVRYPIVALPDSFKTYSVKVANQGLNANDFKISNAEDVINLSYFQKVTGAASINIKIVYGRLKMNQGSRLINSVDELKGLGAEAMVSFELPMSYEITDRRGIVIQKETLGNDNKIYTNEVPAFPPTSVTAIAITTSVTNRVNNGLTTINARIKELFDIYREPYRQEFYIIKDSKTQSYQEYTDVIKNMEEACKRATSEVEIQAGIKKAIEFWEGKTPTFDLNNEDQKDHHFLCMYNLAVAYSLADDFVKSAEYIEKTKGTGVKPGYAGLMQNEINQRKKFKDQYLAEKEKLKQDPNNIYQKGQVKQAAPSSIFEVNKKPAAQSEFMEQGYIVLTSGDSLFGSFLEFDSNRKNGKVLFVENGKPQKTFNSPYSTIRNISIRGMVYYTDGKGGLLKVIYSSPAIVALSSGVRTLFIFPQKNINRVYEGFDPDDGASYVTNYKKRLAEVFKDVCPAVEQNATKGSYDLKKEGTKSLEAAIKDFETQCGSKEFDKNMAALEESKIKALYK